MKISRRSTIVASAVAVTVTGITVGSIAAAVGSYASSNATKVLDVRTDLRDLHPMSAGPLDQASARVQLLTYKGTSTVTLRVRDIDPAVAGHSFGAHLHTGPCVAGDGAAAGPHYNADAVAGRVPATVSAQTEVWLDFTVSRTGSGSARAVVPFVPRPGNRSIVIHQDPTDHHGVAGPRVACVPLSW
jgi:hypothetical protein